MSKSMFHVLGFVASLVVGGAAVAADAPAVEWKVSDGGNGHWYQVQPKVADWFSCRVAAISQGADLACLSSATESEYVAIIIPYPTTTWNRGFMGGFQDPNSEPTSGWHWVDGSPWGFTNWQSNQPNGGEGFLAIYRGNGVVMWGDYSSSDSDIYWMLLEWSVDCNGDGVVDYGQIQSGELADTNHNGVPDVCDPRVTYVQPISGPASGGTAVNINGMNFPNSVSVLFAGVTATDVIVISPILITAVTPVGVPGMTVVTVNGVGGEAFYFRSNCQSDLDGSGQVDSSDLGILLLDFGSCGDSAAAAPQEQEPLIFKTTETPTPILNKK